jgi:hypothetical protein
VGGRASPETTRKCVSRLGFGSDLDGEIEDDVGNRSRAFGGGKIGHGGGATASGGSGAPVSSCGRGRAREKGESGQRASLPRSEALVAASGNGGAVERWRRRPKARAAMWRRRARALGFRGRKAVAAAGARARVAVP